MNKKIVLTLIAIILVAAFIFLRLVKPEITGNTVQEITENGSLSIYFCPNQNCSDHLAEALETANQKIDCAFFDLNVQPIATILSQKAKAMPVRVVIDNENIEHLEKLDYSFPFIVDSKSQYSHNKFCVIDGKIVITGSMNPTLRDDKMNNNNVLVFGSTYFAKNYEAEFNELWSKQFGKGKPNLYTKILFNGIPMENYFCPEDHCEQQVVDEIRKANHSVYFMTFSFTSEEIADAMLFNENLDDVKGIFEKSQAGSEYSQYERLKGFGMDVIIDKNKYNMHNKVFIIDNQTVITGSYNPSTSGDERNDENIVIIHDKAIAAKFVREFNSLFYS